MKTTSANFAAVRDAFDFVSFGQPLEHSAYVSLETGEIYLHSEIGDNEEQLPADIDEPGLYIEIPHKNDLGLGKPLALRFVSDHLPEDYDKVQEIFSHRGAYARFKDFLEASSMLQRWYEYEEEATQAALREWCTENEIGLGG